MKSSVLQTMNLRSIFGSKILYLAGRVILNEHQGNGLGRKALCNALEYKKPDVICSVTRNPNVVVMLARAASIKPEQIYPINTHVGLPLYQMAKIASVPAEDLPIHVSRYPINGLLGVKPKDSSSEHVNKYFESLPLSTGVLIGCRYNKEEIYEQY